MDLSIVVPIYNGSLYICDIVKKVFNIKENLLVEIIFVDDGSSDDSWNKLKYISKDNQQISVFKKENGGIASARNYGIAHAKGNVVMFFDQDDDFDMESVCRIYRSFVKSNSDFCITNYFIQSKEKIYKNYITRNNVVYGHKLSLISKDFLTTHRVPYTLMEQECGLTSVPPVIWNCMFKTHFIKSNGISFFKFVDYEDDFLFMVQCISKAQRVLLCSEAYYSWIIHSESESHKDKYIENFKTKRIKMNNWLINCAKEQNIKDLELYSFECFLYKLLCLKGFANICSNANINKLDSKLKELQELCNARENDEVFDLNNNSFKDKIIIFLLSRELFLIALIFDKLSKIIN